MSESYFLVYSWLPFQSVQLGHEMVTWFALVYTFTVIRMVTRRLIAGSWRKLWVEDWMTPVAAILYLALFVLISSISESVYVFEDGIAENIAFLAPPEKRVRALKLLMLAEQVNIALIWFIKCIFLVFFGRLTEGTKAHKLVLWTSAYVALCFMIMEILYFTAWCDHVSAYWSSGMHCMMPPKGHLFTNAVSNISSDILILAIPICFFRRRGLPWKQWVPLAAMFSFGLSTIVAAILSKYYTLTDPVGMKWVTWYWREGSLAMISLCFPNLLSAINRFAFPVLHILRPGYVDSNHRAELITFELHTMPVGNKPLTESTGWLPMSIFHTKTPSESGTTVSSFEPATSSLKNMDQAVVREIERLS